jgi:hypothetical protein
MKKPDLLDLRPCQFVLGMKEVEYKILKMGKMGKRELDDYCRSHVIPVILGPNKEPYVIDHHHFARACWELGFDSYLVKVIKDFSRMKSADFWNEMIKRNWAYLHDQFGFGPHSPYALPIDIRCLADDPFRSLVWTVIDEGAIRKDKVPFFEFQWAAFFRLNLDLRLNSKSDFKTATKLAVKLARSKAASHLPGAV